jgi:hypothetical protein
MTGIFRIAIIAAVTLVATLEIPHACNAVTSSGGVLYLRAQYKLITGDAESARRLMEKALEAERHAASPALVSQPANACTHAGDVNFAAL